MNIHLQHYQHLFDHTNQKIKELLTVGDSVALVGNSGILSGANHGGGIDDHDYVVRFNAAPVDGYEEDVGSKTTHRFLNVLLQRGGSLDHTTDKTEGFVGEIRDEIVILKSTHRSIQRRAKGSLDRSCEILAMKNTYSKFFSLVVENFFNGSWNVSTLSLGIQGAFIFLPLVNRMDLYGYNAYSSEDIANYHYWEEFTEDNPGPHAYNQEKEILNELDELNGVEVHR